MAHGCDPTTWEDEAGGLCKFEAMLGYIAIFCLKRNKNKRINGPRKMRLERESKMGRMVWTPEAQGTCTERVAFE